MTVGAGGRIVATPMLLQHNATQGYHLCTRKGSNKLARIAAHPAVTLFVGKADPSASVFAKVDAVATAVEDPAVKAACWKDSFTNFGYKSASDPNLVVITLQIKAVTSTRIPRPTPTLDMEGLHTAYKESPFVGLTTHGEGGRLATRPMWLRHHPTFSYHFATHAATRKLAHIAASPAVSFVVGGAGPSSSGFVKVDAIATAVSDPDVKQSLWKDEYVKFGYKGPADPSFVIIKLQITRIVATQMPRPPKSLNTEALDAAYKESPVVALATVDAGGRLAVRPMWMRRDAGVGYHFCTHAHTRKLAHLATHPRVSLLVGNPGSVKVEATATVVEDPAVKLSLWNNDYTKFGYKGPTDPDFVIIKLDITNITAATLPTATTTAAPAVVINTAATEALEAATAAHSTVVLLTHEGGRLHGRPMVLHHHPALGPYMVTHSTTKKLAQIALKTPAPPSLLARPSTSRRVWCARFAPNVLSKKQLGKTTSPSTE
eukprot:TRINITY_DN1952_c0_g1_i8.p1 TRINITY_DN1952_c0_g1~~TRINITY_DN1952_c0_g1_i8.p1  ORF type:complete len:488 (-),score=188.28 TRINITY_DN1952_c0_g1_i8:133-1596(-)